MATYISLIKFTQQGIATIKDGQPASTAERRH
jgi:uncharacterized protein with GYD domain